MKKKIQDMKNKSSIYLISPMFKKKHVIHIIKTRKDMTHSVISIDSILLNSMRIGKIVIFHGRKTWA